MDMQIRLQLLCDEYQRILRLQDWRVHVQIVRADRMAKAGDEGCVEWLLTRKEATISILAPDDYNFTRPQDMELTLCHELLHLHMVPLNIKEETFEDMAQEQAIEAISEAIVSSRRERLGKIRAPLF